MRTYESLQKKNTLRSGLWAVLAVLVVLELCSVSILFSRIASYSPIQKRNYIYLTEATEQTTLEIGQKDQLLPGSYRLPGSNRAHYAPMQQRITGIAALDENSDKVGFWTSDENKIWSTKTDIEIFRLQHDNNGDLVFTVISSDGDKVFAPGTENDYSFTLKNTNTVSLDYTLSVEAYCRTEVDGKEYWLPIQGRLYNHDAGAYMVGSETEWPDVLELDGTVENGVIAAGHIKDYTLQWRWPFERGDQIQEGLYQGDYTEDFYDTMLGNLAVDNDLELHIIIRTSAWIDENPEKPGGKPPYTGDDNNPTVWIVIAAAALVGLVFMLILLKRDRKQKDRAENA